MTSHLPLVQARIGNNDYTFALDTGAEANLIDVKFFERVSEELKKIKKILSQDWIKTPRRPIQGSLKSYLLEGKHLKTEQLFLEIFLI